MNPKVQVKSRHTLIRKQLPILKMNMTVALHKFFEKELPVVKGVGFTMDGWTSRATQDYLSLTLHIIDSQFELQTFTLGCRPFEQRHTGEEIASLAEKMIKQIPFLSVDISRYMVTDGAKNMGKAFKDSLEINEHLVCVAHTISNCLKDGLKVVDDVVKRCKDLASTTHKSTRKTEKIRVKCRQLNIPFIKIVQPVATRWNSITLCIESVLKIKEALQAIRDDSDEDFTGKIPTELQFKQLTDLLPILQRIKTATEILEQEKKPTLHLIIPTLLRIGRMSSSPKFAASLPATQKFIKAFEGALEKRIPRQGRDPENLLPCVAHFLDPYFKGNCLHLTFDDEQLQLVAKTVDWIKKNYPEESAEELSQATSSSVDLNQAMAEDEWDTLGSVLQPMTASIARTASIPKPNEDTAIEKELSFYINVASKMTDEKGDILAYWKDNKDKLPLLSGLARSVLCIPATSASSERLFSTAGRIINPQRTLLNSEKAEDLIFMNANFEAISKIMARDKGKWRLRMSEFSVKDQQVSVLDDVSEDEEGEIFEEEEFMNIGSNSEAEEESDSRQSSQEDDKN